MKNKESRKEYWYCFIGPVERSKVPFGGDFPLRMSVQERFESMFPEDPDFVCSSGWGTSEEMRRRISKIQNLHITDPSGKTLAMIDKALDANTKRLIKIEKEYNEGNLS